MISSLEVNNPQLPYDPENRNDPPACIWLSQKGQGQIYLIDPGTIKNRPLSAAREPY